MVREEKLDDVFVIALMIWTSSSSQAIFNPRARLRPGRKRRLNASYQNHDNDCALQVDRIREEMKIDDHDDSSTLLLDVIQRTLSMIAPSHPRQPFRPDDLRYS